MDEHRPLTDSITNYAQSNEAQATKDSKLKLIAFSTKSTNFTAKYTQTDRKKTKRSDTQYDGYEKVPSHVGILGNEATDDAAKEALNEETHHTETYPQQDLMAWIKKTRTRTTRKMGKLDHNHERAQTTQHNEHKHQNDDENQTRAAYALDIPEPPFINQ
jgi:hypothetical protein